MNRAKRAFDSCKHSCLGVGLESGVLDSKDGTSLPFLCLFSVRRKETSCRNLLILALPDCVKKTSSLWAITAHSMLRV